MPDLEKFVYYFTCECYTITLQQKTSKKHTCSYIVFFKNKLPCTLLALQLLTLFSYAYVINITQKHYNKMHLNDVLALVFFL